MVTVWDPNTNFVHTIFSLRSHSFLLMKSTASSFESQKTVNSNIVTVKVGEKCFVQTQFIPTVGGTFR